ncbi:MAG: response regulator [Actinobacteria bacterium]|nr:response regulator [Actinomycetota bacterium]
MAPDLDARILIIDDNPDMVWILQTLLEREGYHEIASATDPGTAVDTFIAFEPDLVLLDLHMPNKNGLDVMAEIKEVARDFVPVVMLTGDLNPEVRLRALGSGAHDFLTKPFEKTEVHLRIRNLLETRRLHKLLRNENELLEKKVAERTQDLERAKVEILQRLAMASEFRDDCTGEHTQRVGELSARMALVLGLSPRQVDLIRAAAPLHDIGKIAVPDHILLKEGRLTTEEWEVMKRHTDTGARMLSKSVSPTLRLGERIALSHHERWDGTGYHGIRAANVPLAARLVTVADAFDAMTHPRPYKEALAVDAAIEEIKSERARQFDPSVVDAFCDAYADMKLAV